MESNFKKQKGAKNEPKSTLEVENEILKKNKKEQKMKYRSEFQAFIKFFKLFVLPQMVAISFIAISEVA